jgi:hypothetical protein
LRVELVVTEFVHEPPVVSGGTVAAGEGRGGGEVPEAGWRKLIVLGGETAAVDLKALGDVPAPAEEGEGLVGKEEGGLEEDVAGGGEGGGGGYCEDDEEEGHARHGLLLLMRITKIGSLVRQKTAIGPRTNKWNLRIAFICVIPEALSGSADEGPLTNSQHLKSRHGGLPSGGGGVESVDIVHGVELPQLQPLQHHPLLQKQRRAP